MIKREYVYTDELDQRAADLLASGVFAIHGHSSIFVPSEQTKYINKSVCRYWPDLEGEVYPMTPGEAAREELKREFPGVSLRARKRDFFHLDLSPPNYCQGPYKGWLAYVDLIGAYHQLYQHLTLDVCWPRGQGDMFLRPVADRLKDWKAARNSVVGVSRSHQISVIKEGRLQWQKMHNPFFNPHLWRHIQECLHEIAAVARKNHAIYIATDGYLFPTPAGARRFMSFLDSFGLRYRTGESADSWVTGWGSYGVPGVKETKRRSKFTGLISNLTMPKLEVLPWTVKW